MASYWYDSLASLLDAPPTWATPAPALVDVRPIGNGSMLIQDSRTVEAHIGSSSLLTTQYFECVLKFRALVPATAAFQLGGPGVRLREVDSDNYLEIRAGSAGSHLIGNIRERLLANTNDTQIPALWTGAAGTWRLMRIKVSGTQVQVRGWVQGDAEPGTWAITHTLAATPAPGTCRFMYPYAVGGTLEVAYLAISDSGTPPTGPTRVISGNVVDALEQGVSRKVAAYWRATGRKVAETTSAAMTGAYTLAVESAGEYTLVVFDDAGGVLENDFAMRVLV
jgi:hypothetical protein